MATESSEGNVTAFRALVRHLNEESRVAEGDADSVTSQYKKFPEEVVPQNKSLDSSHRVDQLHCVQKKTPTHIFIHISMNYLYI